MTYPDWLPLIDRRAALRERFPTLAKIRTERPGTATDKTRTAQHQADNQASMQAAAERRWEQATELNEKRNLTSTRRTANTAYKNRNRKENAS